MVRWMTLKYENKIDIYQPQTNFVLWSIIKWYNLNRRRMDSGGNSNNEQKEFLENLWVSLNK